MIEDSEIYMDCAKHLFNFSGYTNIEENKDLNFLKSDQAICIFVKKTTK